jgi:hypothetical protein
MQNDVIFASVHYIQRLNMLRFMSVVMLISLATASFADQMSGDVNFGLDASPDNHAYKFRLLVNDSSITFSTGCVSPDTGLAQALTYGAIGRPNGRLTIQASDCEQDKDKWITLNGYWDYESNYWYDVYVNMLDNSFHL